MHLKWGPVPDYTFGQFGPLRIYRSWPSKFNDVDRKIVHVIYSPVQFRLVWGLGWMSLLAPRVHETVVDGLFPPCTNVQGTFGKHSFSYKMLLFLFFDGLPDLATQEKIEKVNVNSTSAFPLFFPSRDGKLLSTLDPWGMESIEQWKIGIRFWSSESCQTYP